MPRRHSILIPKVCLVYGLKYLKVSPSVPPYLQPLRQEGNRRRYQNLTGFKACGAKVKEKSQRMVRRGQRKDQKWKKFLNFHLKPTPCELKGDDERTVKKRRHPSYGPLFTPVWLTVRLSS